MASNGKKQELSNVAHFGYQVLPELLKEWCGTEKLSGTRIGMIPGMRQTHERQIVGGVELIKVAQDYGGPAETQQTAPTPRISNMTNPKK